MDNILHSWPVGDVKTQITLQKIVSNSSGSIVVVIVVVAVVVVVVIGD